MNGEVDDMCEQDGVSLKSRDGIKNTCGSFLIFVHKQKLLRNK